MYPNNGTLGGRLKLYVCSTNRSRARSALCLAFRELLSWQARLPCPYRRTSYSEERKSFYPARAA